MKRLLALALSIGGVCANDMRLGNGIPTGNSLKGVTTLSVRDYDAVLGLTGDMTTWDKQSGDVSMLQAEAEFELRKVGMKVVPAPSGRRARGD
jgi:hypothetical protein